MARFYPLPYSHTDHQSAPFSSLMRKASRPTRIGRRLVPGCLPFEPRSPNFDAFWTLAVAAAGSDGPRAYNGLEYTLIRRVAEDACEMVKRGPTSPASRDLDCRLVSPLKSEDHETKRPALHRNRNRPCTALLVQLGSERCCLSIASLALGAAPDLRAGRWVPRRRTPLPLPNGRLRHRLRSLQKAASLRGCECPYLFHRVTSRDSFLAKTSRQQEGRAQLRNQALPHR